MRLNTLQVHYCKGMFGKRRMGKYLALRNCTRCTLTPIPVCEILDLVATCRSDHAGSTA